MGSIDEPFTQQKDRKILELGLSDGPPHSPSLKLNVEDPRRQPGASMQMTMENESYSGKEVNATKPGTSPGGLD